MLVDGELVLVQNTDRGIDRIAGRVPAGAQVLRVAVVARGGGGFDVTLYAAEHVLGSGEIPNMPTVRAPDGAFLTIGYSRPFPVTDEYAPPFPAPASLDSVTITTGPPPPFDLEVELARVMRHQ